MRYPVLSYISVYSPILPILICLAQWKKLNRELKILFFLLSLGFITDFLSLLHILNARYLPYLAHFYVVSEFILVMMIITLWQTSKKMMIAINSIIIAYVIFWIIAKLFFEPINRPY